MPSASVTADRVNPVCGLFAVTVTPGIAALCGSSARPLMLPVVCWPNAGVLPATSNARPSTTRPVVLTMIDGLLESRERCCDELGCKSNQVANAPLDRVTCARREDLG